MHCKENLPSPYSPYFVSPINPDGSWYFDGSSKNLKTIFRQACRLFFSNETYNNLTRLIQREKPDIAYVLLFHKKLSPSVITACVDQNLPIVMRVSDYLPMCPKMTFYRSGHICERCRKTKLFSVVHRCTQSSFASSLLWYFADKWHHFSGIYRAVNTYVVTNPFMKQKMREYGYKSNYQVIASPCDIATHRVVPIQEKIRKKQLCYVGNLFEHKGIRLLIRSFAQFHKSFPEYTLVIMGNDYDRIIASMKAESKELFTGICYKNHSDKSQVLDLLSNSLFSFIPSLWYENLPNSVIESFSVGTPVIAADIGSLPHMVKHNHNGFLYRHGESGALEKIMERSVSTSESHYGMMQKNCLLDVSVKYSHRGHHDKILQLFNRVIAQTRTPHA